MSWGAGAIGATISLPSMFGTSLNQEYEIAARLLGLDAAGVADLARAGVRASFAPEDLKAAMLAEIDAYAQF